MDIKKLEDKHRNRLIDLAEAFGVALDQGEPHEFNFLLQAVAKVLDLATEQSQAQTVEKFNWRNYV